MATKNRSTGGVLLSSDWHCGLTLRGTARDEEIKRVLDDLVDKTVQIRPEAVVVAGDLSDTFRYPGSAPSKLIGRTLFRIVEEAPGTQVFVIPGNHDWDGLDIIALSEKSNIHFIKQPAAVEVSPGLYMIAVPYMRKHNLGSSSYDSIINGIADNIPAGARCFAAVHAAYEGTVPGIGEPVVTGESLAGRVEKLFLGHIHTHRQVCTDVYYTGALIRNTFGEEKEISGAWHMDRDLNVTDVPLEGARKMVTIQMDDMAEVMNGGLEERLSDVISSDPDVMVRIRIPGGAASSEYASEIVKRTEEKWSEPGRNVIISDFSLPKPEKDKSGQEEHKLKADTSSDGRSVAEQISVKGLWSSYCKERLGLIGAPEEDIAVAEICGEALLSGTPPSDIWKAMKEGRFSEIRTELAEKEKGEIPEAVSPTEPPRGPVMLKEEDLEEITLDIDI